MHHVYVDSHELALWIESTGPWWTNMTPKGYVLILAVRVDPTAMNEVENPCCLHTGSDEPTMAAGEPNTMANADTAFRTTSLKTNSTEMKHRLSRTQWGT